MDEKLMAPNPDSLTYIKNGVLWVKKQPYYIVELIKEEDMSYVMVYGVQPGTDDNPKKAAMQIQNNANRFSNNTLLGQLANTMFPAKQTVKWVEKDPLFVAPVVPNQINTFTGQTESGFFEREPDTVTVEAGKKKMVRGRNTGIFIGLSSVTWEDRVHIPTASLVKALRQYQAQHSFYDLYGNNNDKGNPLSTYYRGGDM